MYRVERSINFDKKKWIIIIYLIIIIIGIFNKIRYNKFLIKCEKLIFVKNRKKNILWI